MLLLGRLLKELFRYDLMMAIRGFRGVRRPMPTRKLRLAPASETLSPQFVRQ